MSRRVFVFIFMLAFGGPIACRSKMRLFANSAPR